MSQRSLLITGIALMVAGILVGGVVGPLVDQAYAPTGSRQEQLGPAPEGQYGPFRHRMMPGGGYFGPGMRHPAPSPSPNL